MILAISVDKEGYEEGGTTFAALDFIALMRKRKEIFRKMIELAFFDSQG
jgi:hypothetical protein